MKSTSASANSHTISAVSCGRKPSAGLTIEPMIGLLWTPVSARLPAMPNCGPGWAAANSGGSFMSTILMPLKPLIEKTPPIAIVVNAARSVPMASSGNSMSASPRE